MTFLLDTDTCSAHLRKGNLTSRMVQYAGRLYTSRLALAELYVWVHSGSDTARRRQRIDWFLDDVRILEFDDDCAREFGRLRARLRKRGITVPTVDLMIAVTAIVHDYTIVTHNRRDFEKIPGLRIVDWLE